MERALRLVAHVQPQLSHATATTTTASASGPFTLPPNTCGRNKLKNCSDEEWELRCDLAAAYRLFENYGWSEVIYNHLTVRVPNTNYFLLNPFGLRFGEITASSLVKVDADGGIVDQGTTNLPINPAGFVIHSAVHMARDDMHCVMHVHTIEGSAVMAMKCGLLQLSQLSHVAHSGGVSYHDYEGLAVYPDERIRLQKNLGPVSKVFLLRNHGILTGGHTIAEAFFFMYYTIQACKIQIGAMSGGLANLNFPKEEVTRDFADGLKPFLARGPGKEMFDALKRTLPDNYRV